MNWGGPWWELAELHYGIVLGDKSVPDQNIPQISWREDSCFSQLLPPIFWFLWWAMIKSKPITILSQTFSLSMQKIRIQFCEQPLENHCKNEHSQNRGHNAIQYNTVSSHTRNLKMVKRKISLLTLFHPFYFKSKYVKLSFSYFNILFIHQIFVALSWAPMGYH